ncbi:MAG: type II secretion system protein G [Thermoanaerobaculia bacterium]
MRRLRHLFLLAGLVLIAATACRNGEKEAAEAGLKSNLHALRQLIQQYREDQGGFPPTLTVLVELGYVRRVPYDPLTRRNDTWIETLESGTANASFGIVDVHSGASGTALDGSKYVDW